MLRWSGPIAAASCSACSAVRPPVPPSSRPLILKDGQRITGEVVAEKPNALVRRPGIRHPADPRDQIMRRTKVDEADAGQRGRAPGASSRTRRASSRPGVLKPSGGQGAGRQVSARP